MSGVRTALTGVKVPRDAMLLLPIVTGMPPSPRQPQCPWQIVSTIHVSNLFVLIDNLNLNFAITATTF